MEDVILLSLFKQEVCLLTLRNVRNYYVKRVVYKEKMHDF